MLAKQPNSPSSIYADCAAKTHYGLFSIELIVPRSPWLRKVIAIPAMFEKSIGDIRTPYIRFLLVFLSLLWADCVFAQLAYPAREDSELMATVLMRLAQRADPLANIYLNKQRAEGMSSIMNQPMSMGKRINMGVRIAQERIRAGDTRAGIADLERLLEIVESDRVPATEEFIFMLHDQLGIAWLRLGEQENCLENHTTDSCLLPIRKNGVHTLDEGSRRAIEHYEINLKKRPDHLGTRWLLNLAYMTLGEHPDGVPEAWRLPPEIFNGDGGIERFKDVAASVGVAAVGLAGGSAVEDFDGDGLIDIVVSSWGLFDPLRYFRNVGDGTFSEQTEKAGISGQIGGLNIEQADYDNDGDVDLLVLRGAWMGEEGRIPNSLLRNEGNGTFVDVTRQSGLFTRHPSNSAAFADYDNDGWLDLFVGNESGRQPHACQLFRNRGDGTFVDVAPSLGLDHVGFVKGVTWGDVDNDGLIDLYVSQFYQDNVLYRNMGKVEGAWRFTSSTLMPGPSQSFPTWFWDYDNDGWLDLFVGGYNMDELGDMARAYLGEAFEADHARMYRNLGAGRFEEVTDTIGQMNRVILAMGANYGDIDSDGFPDCYVGTGLPDLRSLTPNRMLRNVAGTRFVDVTTAGGFGNVQKGHAVSFADFDNDGDQDVFEVMGGAYEGDLYQNVLYENPGNKNRWLRLYPEGVQSNRGAVGGRVRVRVLDEDGTTRDVHHLIGSGGSFGANPLSPQLGLGRATELEFVEITWPATQEVQRWRGLSFDRAYRLRERETVASEVELPRMHFRRVHRAEHAH